jgi:pimeloyl-ACP methyl ester carboxylesterase
MDIPPIRYATAADGARISYLRFPGESPPFLAMYNPGSPQLALKARLAGYTHFARDFRRGRAWVLFDWRGTGLSSPIEGSLSVDDLALDVEGVITELGEPVDAIAVENACHPVLALAARAPACYRSLWIQAPWSARNQRVNRPGWEADYVGHLHDIMVHAGARHPLAAEIATTWEQGVPASVFGAYLNAVRTADSWDLLPQVAQPV